ncbi:MAG: acyl-CoA dehydrogenase [Proteobacteria bacterium]|nr:acyl-CoA dehydrogenase [Pseudomonadota bacterium]
MSGFSQVFLGLLLVWAIAFYRIPRWLWPFIIAIILYSLTCLHWVNYSAWFLWPLLIFIALVVNIAPLRYRLDEKIFTWFRGALPLMSQTEQQAIEAGGVWLEKDLLQGTMDWKQFLSMQKPNLKPEEQAFLDEKVEILCRMLEDWKIVHELSDLTPEIWAFLKAEKFFAMIIPKEFGGLGFSAFAHSCVITKIATRSISAAVTVMVPNSLGPAELLLHYGTIEQQQHYLPRLACGDEIPCFALTSKEAGSDASAIEDNGIVCKGNHEGKEVIGIRLNFDKRYITLAPVATVFGLAFKLYDPNHLLFDKIEVGITLCLIPTNHPGVQIGQRHFPLNMAFMNGPIRGKDVFVPIEWIIGGAKMAGSGWRMLMECLSAGRGISLPALSTATGMLSLRMTSAYCAIRKQFSVSIGTFEGIEQPLARIAGLTYLLQATRSLTACGVDQGFKPSVATAIAKYHMTEMARKVINDAMDIHGGRGIMLGPSNYLGRGYQAIPISITVEGANILTRSLMIFGQGAIRCHPYVKKELQAAQLYNTDKEEALKLFDKSLISHIGYFISNAVKCFTFAVSCGYLSFVPTNHKTKVYIKKLNWLSVALAFATDIALLSLGGSLKRKENTSARLGDVLSQLYMAAATIKYYHDEGNQDSDWPLVTWALQMCLFETQEAFYGLFNNFPKPYVGSFLKWFIFPFGKVFSLPKDIIYHECAKGTQEVPDLRNRLTSLCYIGRTKQDPTGLMEATYNQLLKVQPFKAKMDLAIKQKEIDKTLSFNDKLVLAISKKILTQEEVEMLIEYENLHKKAIAVDEFTSEYFLGKKQNETPK